MALPVGLADFDPADAEMAVTDLHIDVPGAAARVDAEWDAQTQMIRWVLQGTDFPEGFAARISEDGALRFVKDDG